MSNKNYKIATVCSGIGAPEFGLHELAKEQGFEVENVFACEIDKYARASYLANHKPNVMYEDMTSEYFHENAGYSDLFIGGIPCQSFSLAGKRLGELDKRGLLFYDFYRYVKEKQPKAFIIENVKGLLSDAGGKTFQNWLLLLGNSVNSHSQMFNHPDSLEYNLHHTVLNSKNFGVPQNRERVFIVGIRKDLPNNFRFPIGWKLDKRLKDVLETNVDEKYYLSDKMLNYLTSNSEKQKLNGNGFKFTPTDGNCIGKAVTTKEGSRMDDNFISVKEATKQGFAIAEPGDSINLSNPETRRGRVGKQIANTLDTACNQAVVEPYCVAMRGRNPENPNDRTTGAPTKQRLEPNSQGTTNTITSVQKDNLIVEPNIKFVGGVGDVLRNKDSNGFHSRDWRHQDRIYDAEGVSETISTLSTTSFYKIEPKLNQIHQLKGSHEATGRVYDANGLCPTITAKQGGGHEPKTSIGSRIRRLTPLECWRLQGFPDEAFYKAKAVSSDTQLYKQAGNSMTKTVMEAIIDNLIQVL